MAAGAMTLAELTAAMHAFVESKGWTAPDSPHPQTSRSLAISLALEAAEVLEHYQWGEGPANREELASELADVLLYLLQIASLNDIDLAQAVLHKLARNQHREW
jgi:NTP pyrophosphatase (non-canonical NTP hydrolase)